MSKMNWIGVCFSISVLSMLLVYSQRPSLDSTEAPAPPTILLPAKILKSDRIDSSDFSRFLTKDEKVRINLSYLMGQSPAFREANVNFDLQKFGENPDGSEIIFPTGMPLKFELKEMCTVQQVANLVSLESDATDWGQAAGPMTVYGQLKATQTYREFTAQVRSNPCVRSVHTIEPTPRNVSTN